MRALLAAMGRQCTAPLARDLRAATGADYAGIGTIDVGRDALLLSTTDSGSGSDEIGAGQRLRLSDPARDAVDDERPWISSLGRRSQDPLALRLWAQGLSTALLLPFGASLPVAGGVLLAWGRHRPVTEELLARARAVLHADMGTLRALLLAESEHARARQLEDVLAFHDEMIQIVAHDLATPVGVVSGFTRLVRQRRGSREDLDRWLDAVARNTLELESLVDNLRAMTLVERAPLPAAAQPFDLARLCQDLVDDLTITAGREVRVHSSPVQALGDAGHTRRVLHNLLSNAVKYSPCETTIEVTVASDDLRAVVSVTDHGPGIPDDRRSEVFERFARLHRDEDAAVAGTGLGLYIARILTEAQGGEIDLTSPPGGGTTFEVALPLHGGG